MLPNLLFLGHKVNQVFFKCLKTSLESKRLVLDKQAVISVTYNPDLLFYCLLKSLRNNKKANLDYIMLQTFFLFVFFSKIPKKRNKI